MAGYIGSVSFLNEVREVILDLKKTNPDLTYGTQSPLLLLYLSRIEIYNALEMKHLIHLIALGI